jgi:Tol biopolymer transport system component
MKAVGSEVIRRVVETAEDESRPACSPDGREIAFARTSGTKELGIFIVSSLGGTDRRISETGTGVAWIPDGKSVLIRDRLRQGATTFAIFHVDLDTRQRRRLTEPLVGGGDRAFELSPDGETLAFIRYQRPGISDLYVMPMKGGEPRRLTGWNTILNRPAWTPDGREVICGANDRLWRVSARAAEPGRGSPIPDIPLPAGHVSTSRPSRGQPVRLAFYTPQVQITLRKIDLNSGNAAGVFESVVPFAPATRKDIPGHFSPDGSRVAFTSTRGSADHELWVADGSGAHPRQLSHLGANSLMLAHSWSPDGTRILFEAAVEGNTDLYLIAADGGSPIRLTTSPAIEALGAWSRHSQWIYFTKVRAGMAADVWRIPAQGGPVERITHTGGSEPQESPDGQHIYHLDRPPHGGESRRLMRTPAGGGEATMILEGILPFYWCLTDRGIYFLQEQGHAQSIHLYRFADEKIERAGTLPFRVAYFPRGPGRLTVSRDGHWALISVADRFEGDLMLLDNFR